MKFIKWDYERLKKLKPTYKDYIRIAIQDENDTIYFAKMNPSSGDISGKFGLTFDEKVNIDIKNLPSNWVMYLIYSESLEMMYREDQEKFKARLENIKNSDGFYDGNGKCLKCDGSGYFSEYEHIDKGKCFNCNGKGYI